MSATTPRSWVIMIIADFVLAWISCMSSRICAWMVTSSAVVGSSAMRMSGPQASAHCDHGPLPHAPRELVWVIARPLTCLRNTHLPEKLNSGRPGLFAIHALVKAQWLRNLFAYPVNRVE